MDRTFLKAAFLATLLLVSTVASAKNAVDNNSLSELNFNVEESVFLKDVPWAKKDPFTHPSFEVKKTDKKTKKGAQQDDLAKSVEEKRPELDVSAILYSEKSQSAVVNGRIVKAGSIINRQRILTIKRDNIDVEFNGKIYNIVLRDFTINDEEE